MKKYLVLGIASLAFSVSAAEKELDCEKASTTIEINQCATIELDLAQQQMTHYFEKSLEHNNYDPELVESIKIAQIEWKKYFNAHCDSVYTQWREGSIRGIMGVSCKTKITKQRTHELWENFLTYMDSTPPVLPEPKL